MPRKLEAVEKSALTSVAVPTGTKSRTVISHAFAIKTIEDALAVNGYVVQEEEYKCTTDARVAQGVLKVNDPNHPDLMMMFSFSNSYDMSLRFRIAIGATITVNQAYMLNEVLQWKRTHTALTDQETAQKIQDHVLKATVHMDALREAKDKMEELTINKSMYGQMIGELFINDVLTTDQISAAAKEFENPSFPYTDQNNVWTCYCHIMTVLKDSHPSKWMQNQQDAHMFFVDTFDLVTPVVPIVAPVQALDGQPSVDPEIPGISDGVEVLEAADLPVTEELVEEELEEVPDPNQTSLIDQIADEETSPSEIAKEMIASEPIVIGKVQLTPEEGGVTPTFGTHQDEAAAPVVEDEALLEEQQDNSEPDPNAIDTKSNIFVDQVDYPGKQIGDLIEVVGDGYCKIVEADSLEGKPLWECEHVDGEELMEAAAEAEELVDPVESAADAFLERTPEAEAPMLVPAVPSEESLEEVAESTQGVIFDDSELQVEEPVPAVEEIPVAEESEFIQQLDKDDTLMHEELPVPEVPEAAAPEVEIPVIDTPEDILEEITEEIHEETLVEEELEETLDEITTEEVVEEIADEQPSLETEPAAEETVEAPAEETPELTVEDEPAVGNDEEVNPLDNFPDSVVLSNQIPENPTPGVPEEDDIRKVIATSLEQLFGEEKEFTYKLEAGEYKINLTENNEDLVLDTEYIQAQVEI